MIMDALETLSQLALASADQLAIMEAVQQSADQDLLCIPDEDILHTSGTLDTPITISEHLANNFVFNSDSNTAAMMGNQGCRQQEQISKYYVFYLFDLHYICICITVALHLTSICI